MFVGMSTCSTRCCGWEATQTKRTRVTHVCPWLGRLFGNRNDPCVDWSYTNDGMVAHCLSAGKREAKEQKSTATQGPKQSCVWLSRSGLVKIGPLIKLLPVTGVLSISMLNVR